MIPEWFEEANCANTDPEAFFKDEMKDPETVALVKRVCLQCRVGELCLKYALENKISDGIWGGTTPREREKIKRRRNYGAI